MQPITIDVPVDATGQQYQAFTADETIVVLFVPNGFQSGTLKITTELNGVEYPRAYTATLNNGACGPFLLDRSQYGFTPNLRARIAPGSAANPPASVHSDGHSTGGRNF